MIDTKELQRAYINMYSAMRNYIWDYNAVKSLANLEVETFSAFPDIQKVRTYLNILKLYARQTTDNDPDVLDTFDEFNDILEKCETSNIYSSLMQVEEVLV